MRADYADWTPFVVGGGVIVLHDSFAWDGPRPGACKRVLRALSQPPSR